MRGFVFTFIVACIFKCAVYGQCENREIQFEFGHDNSPPKKYFGPGAGEWGVESSFLRPDLVHMASAARIALGTESMRRRYGELTVETFARYFENSGENLVVDMEVLLKKSQDLRRNFKMLLHCLHYTVAGFAEGSYSFSMTKMVRGKFQRQESEELYLAIADYGYFAAGKIEIGRGGSMDYDISLGLYDRYDWDPGASIPIAVGGVIIPVSQEFVGSFHRAGLAREFDVTAKGRIVGSTLQ